MRNITYVLLSLVLLYSCNFNSVYRNREEDRDAARKITDEFYLRFSQQNYMGMLDLCSPLFYKEEGKGEVTKKFQNNYNHNGPPIKQTLLRWETIVVKGANPKSKYVLEFNVKYKERNTIETFHLSQESKKIVIMSYHIEYNINDTLP